MNNLNEELTESIINDNGESNRPLDLTKLRSSKSISVSRGNSEAGVISIINSEKNGKRLTLSKGLMDQLNKPHRVQLGFTDNSIVIAENLPLNGTHFVVKHCGTKGVIYSSNLVKEIANDFNLDFTNRTSITLCEVHYSTNDEYLIATITVN